MQVWSLRIAGSAVPNFAFVNPAEALLTVDIQSDERRTYHYNDGTVTVFSTEDLGLISNNATTLEDNGSITGHITGYDNRGFIRDTSTVRSASGTITISGSVDDDFIAENAHTGSGTITFTSTTTTAFIPNWVGTGLFDFSGGDAYAFSLLQIVTGGLFTNGIVGEAVTKHYNISSVETFTTEDYGSITSSATTTEDYGLVTEQDGESVDLGSIGITQTTEPFGCSESVVQRIPSSNQKEDQIPQFYSPFLAQVKNSSFLTGIAVVELLLVVPLVLLLIATSHMSLLVLCLPTASMVRQLPKHTTSLLFYHLTQKIMVQLVDLDLLRITVVSQTLLPMNLTMVTFGSIQDLDNHLAVLPSVVQLTTLVDFTRLCSICCVRYIYCSQQQPRTNGGGILLRTQVWVSSKCRFANTNPLDYIGSGSLFAVGGAAESKTTNKPESTVLFTIGGSGDPPIITPNTLVVEQSRSWNCWRSIRQTWIRGI